MALALEVLADQGGVQLRAVLRVVVAKELQEPARLIVDFFCVARGVLASAACRFDSRMHIEETDRLYFPRSYFPRRRNPVSQKQSTRLRRSTRSPRTTAALPRENL